MKKKVAIIGSGLAGMGVAIQLKEHFNITVFEEGEKVVGNSKSFSISCDQKQFTIDTSFNSINNSEEGLLSLLKTLGARVKPADVSFGIQQHRFGLEFCDKGLDGFFSQRKNLVNARHLKLFLEIKRFQSDCLSDANEIKYSNYTLKQYSKDKGYSSELLNNYLIPITSTIWAVPIHKAPDFPALMPIQYLKNYIISGRNSNKNWLTVENWNDLSTQLRGIDIQINKKVRFVKRQVEFGRMIVVLFFEDGSVEKFDTVIFACHANQALRILEDDATNLEYGLLRNFKYEKNTVKLHTDSTVMPENKKAWASFNYRIDDSGKATAIKWVNRFEQMELTKNYFVSVNDAGEVNEDAILKIVEYEHPLFDLKTTKAQNQLEKLNLQPESEEFEKTTFFCGSYFKNGQYEETFRSAVDCAGAVFQSQKYKIAELKIS
ncbi:NAD(P)-binding protein [Solitalea sp. MAHUQ-68]|uniref:NAD(P)-binding protein n=1 Tax=Solitalea agri TaxID=2953739 RepID=A0A9X2F423_9SPHI|nr:NAD(P)-binding protein [Solitalea agri]MCO4294357.1 NAD(P)-binding protein [Solitalea agri]